MSKQVLKYPIEIGKTLRLELPSGAVPLCVKEQRGQICLWILVPDKFGGGMDKSSRYFHLFMTGEGMSDESVSYIGTVMPDGGDFVLHAFEVL